MKKRRPARIVPFEPKQNGASELIIKGLRQNNLKNLNLKIPHNEITAIVGPSGSGKSSLAFDTLFAEGRWRFIESLSTYTRLFIERMDRPEVDSIQNIRPAIAIEQKNPVRTSRSTVATATEIYDYLRVLFARVGTVHCQGCGKPVSEEDPATLAGKLMEEYSGERTLVGFELNLKEAGDTAMLFDRLLADGFLRVVYKDETYHLGEARPEVDTADEAALLVITDRLVLKEKERARLAAALEESFTRGDGLAWIKRDGKFERFTTAFKCDACLIKAPRPTPLLFSFNHPVGACPECKGFGNILRYNRDLVIQDASLSLEEGAVEPWTKPSYKWWQGELEEHAASLGIDMQTAFEDLPEEKREVVFRGGGGFPGIDGFFEELERKKYKLHIRVFLSRYKGQVLCSSCSGTRLRKTALAVTISGRTIAEITLMTIKEARDFFLSLTLSPTAREVAKEALKQVGGKLEFLNQTGLGYITLSRLTKTLSGGEAQRITLANQMGSALSGVLYILDEPSIGLHPRDIDMLNVQIKKLAARANTVVLVEHDPSVMLSASHILELGPGAGDNGGRLVYSGPKEEFLESARTLTADYLTGRRAIGIPRWRRRGSGDELTVRGASGNNLKGVDLCVPLKTFTCVTGVSGSGKSTLVIDTLYNALAARFRIRAAKPHAFDSLEGASALDGVKLINQEPIGRTPRSNPITYIGGFDEIRKFFASLPSARAANLGPGAFSF